MSGSAASVTVAAWPTAIEAASASAKPATTWSEDRLSIVTKLDDELDDEPVEDEPVPTSRFPSRRPDRPVPEPAGPAVRRAEAELEPPPLTV